jgi:hypothetical protein
MDMNLVRVLSTNDRQWPGQLRLHLDLTPMNSVGRGLPPTLDLPSALPRPAPTDQLVPWLLAAGRLLMLLSPWNSERCAPSTAVKRPTRRGSQLPFFCYPASLLLAASTSWWQTESRPAVAAPMLCRWRTILPSNMSSNKGCGRLFLAPGRRGSTPLSPQVHAEHDDRSSNSASCCF